MVANVVLPKDRLHLEARCISLYFQAETLLAMKDQARDLASAGNLLKKHQLLETEMSAREVGGVGISVLLAECKCFWLSSLVSGGRWGTLSWQT